MKTPVDVSESRSETPDATNSSEGPAGVEEAQDLAQPRGTRRDVSGATLNQLVPGSSPGRGTI